jgi:ribosomal protein S18 acetylase RimI-like enzyme
MDAEALNAAFNAVLNKATVASLAQLKNAPGAIIPAIRVRVETPADLDKSAALYRLTRNAELRMTDWPEAQKQTFCRQQFDAQHAHYQTHYPNAQFLMIERFDESTTNVATAIGRLYFEQTAHELRLMEITLDESERNRGIGGAISAALLAHAMAHGIAMGLHVESFNPARRLYERQGFREVETRGIYLYMRIEPAAGKRVANAAAIS